MDLLDTLSSLLPAQFEAVVLRCGVPGAFLSSPAAPLAARAIELLHWAEQAPRNRTALIAALATVGMQEPGRAGRDAVSVQAIAPTLGDRAPRAAPLVFISYSHADEAWKDRLRTQLDVLRLHGNLAVWDDRQIETGDDWRSDIDGALTSARVAILLISARFLTSKFINDVEVPRALRRRAEEGLRVVPVIAEPCPWQDVEWLSKMQAYPRDGRPLAGMSPYDADVALVELARAVKRWIEAAPAGRP